MPIEFVVTCDTCGEQIVGQNYVVVNASEADTGPGMTTVPVQKVYHPDHVPAELKAALGFEFGNLVIPPPEQ